MIEYSLEERKRVLYNVSKQSSVEFRDIGVIFSPFYFQNDQYTFVPVHLCIFPGDDSVRYEVQISDPYNSCKLWIDDRDDFLIKVPHDDKYRAELKVARVFRECRYESVKEIEISVEFPVFPALEQQCNTNRLINCMQAYRFEYMWMIWNEGWFDDTFPIKEILCEKILSMKDNYNHPDGITSFEVDLWPSYYLCRENDYTVCVEGVFVKVTNIDEEGVLTIIFEDTNIPCGSDDDIELLPPEDPFTEWCGIFKIPRLPTKIRYLDIWEDDDSKYYRMAFCFNDKRVIYATVIR